MIDMLETVPGPTFWQDCWPSLGTPARVIILTSQIYILYHGQSEYNGGTWDFPRFYFGDEKRKHGHSRGFRDIRFPKHWRGFVQRLALSPGFLPSISASGIQWALI